MNSLKVVFIISSGHSGSTLLNLLLGSCGKISSIGEIKRLHNYLEEDTKLNNLDCTCGAIVNNCSFWNQVLEGAGGKKQFLTPLDNEEGFAERNLRLIKSISDVTGNKIICDNSKNIDRLDKILQIRGLNVNIIHLIRDGRAVAYSFKRKEEKIRNSGNKYLEEMKYLGKDIKMYDYNRSLSKWAQYNDKVKKKYGHLACYQQIKYEDLVEQPLQSLNKIFYNIGAPKVDEIPEFKHENVHSIGGNRMRFEFGFTGIESDNSYKNQITWHEWISSTMRHYGQLAKYGYGVTDKFT